MLTVAMNIERRLEISPSGGAWSPRAIQSLQENVMGLIKLRRDNH
jgi:hypothetical protein